MAAADLYGAMIAFLNGDAGDVRSGVNADVGSSLLVAGSVTEQRDRREFPRDGKLPDVSVEIVRGPATPERAELLGYVQSDVVLDFYCTVRRKDTPKGQVQVGLLDDMTRALRRRYQGKSNLAITVTGATFMSSAADIREHDVDSTVTEPARAVVRAVFTFLEPLADNA